ncbi:condensation domain-containing protein [Streptomyces lancefieldiae]|uniref:condensation domain-containing protein n=1 Tax=Streptomyces lancefieldiae TaxID=3075520 RepID=UPI00374E07FE
MRGGRAVLAVPTVVDHDDPAVVRYRRRLLAMVLGYREPAGTELRKALYEASARSFALTGELPFRAWLFALGPRYHVLLLSMHNMVSDGWSRQLLARYPSRAYAARRRGVTPDTPRLPVSYADYVGMPEKLRLPVGRPHRPVSDGVCGTITFGVDEGVAHGADRGGPGRGRDAVQGPQPSSGPQPGRRSRPNRA